MRAVTDTPDTVWPLEFTSSPVHGPAAPCCETFVTHVAPPKRRGKSRNDE
jgi:hypothetical protein